MADPRFAVEFTVDVCDLIEDEIDELHERIQEAIHAWKPFITRTVREY